MANQGGSHEQHVKAGQQSHKNADSSSSSKSSDTKSGKNARGGDSEQKSKAGKQSGKNSH